MRRGLAADPQEAATLVAARRVTVDGSPALNPRRQVRSGEAVAVVPAPPPFVSRGGVKLAHALDAFGLDVAGWRCVDAGASTGGFTDCLLQRGAAGVVAVDVGYGLLHERLRRDPRVTVLERTHVAALTPQELPGPPVDLVVADLSFISLASVLPHLRALARPGGQAVVLVKPQFEAPREEVGEGGVVVDPEVWTGVLRAVCAAAAAVGWPCHDVTPSPLRGPAGNVEFLAHLAPGESGGEEERIDAAVREAGGGAGRREEAEERQ